MAKTYHCGCGAEITRSSKTGRCVECSKAHEAQKRAVNAKGSGRLAGDYVSVSNDVCEVGQVTPRRIKNLDDLLAVCEIDLNEWEIERWVCNRWEMGSIPRATAETPGAWRRDNTRPVVTPLYQVKAWFRRKSPMIKTLETLRAGLIDDIRAELKKAPVIHKPKAFPDSDWLFEFAPFDLHAGKYAWDEETVANYDLDIAADLFNASLDFLLERALLVTSGKLSRALCVFGNDVSHIDSKRGETTHGTRMDVDTRYIKVFRRIREIHQRAINRVLDVCPVDVVVIPGNHDELTSFHLGEILAAFYSGHKRVSIDNSPRLTKYYEYGVNLFGFTHGDALAVADLPLLMAREAPDAWARCPSREWHIGHKHIKEKSSLQPTQRAIQDVYSDKGVRVRRLTSLSAHDAWHTKHGYVDRRACEGFIYHRTAGYTAEVSFNVDHFTGQPLLPAKESV